MQRLFVVVSMSIALFFLSISVALSQQTEKYPTKENPLIINEKQKTVMIYTEVNEMNVHQYNVHWGVVFKGGRFQDRAILRAYVNHLDFHDALIKIGAKPGNNLNKDTIGHYVAGDIIDIKATWPGLGKELSLNEIFEDTSGKGFEIRFGGNRKASEEQNTGCITCLESCWISISSNAKYPQTHAFQRFVNPNSKFRGKSNVLLGEGKPVILIYRLASLK
ncbi:MAG: YdjY domain-containing protein [Thermodesulfovibrionales bacterium]|nr:YdjY domain-containing protein [Thermodesulfovibrionales bacterium]